jgi:ubiquilin
MTAQQRTGGAAPGAAAGTTPSEAGSAPANPLAGLFGSADGGAAALDQMARMFGGTGRPGAFDAASLFGPGGFNFDPHGPGLGALGPPTGAQIPPLDPPEVLYEAQLRQLNEMGFHDYDRNVRALRMAGGNVQGAVERLFDGSLD